VGMMRFVTSWLYSATALFVVACLGFIFLHRYA